MNGPGPDMIFVEALEVECRIGTREAERHVRQTLLIDLEMMTDARRSGETDDLADAIDYQAACDAVIDLLSKSSFQLIETVAERVATRLLGRFPIKELGVVVRKPGAVEEAGNVGVRITRRRSDDPTDCGGLS